MVWNLPTVTLRATPCILECKGKEELEVHFCTFQVWRFISGLLHWEDISLHAFAFLACCNLKLLHTGLLQLIEMLLTTSAVDGKTRQNPRWRYKLLWWDFMALRLSRRPTIFLSTVSFKKCLWTDRLWTSKWILSYYSNRHVPPKGK